MAANCIQCQKEITDGLAICKDCNARLPINVRTRRTGAITALVGVLIMIGTFLTARNGMDNQYGASAFFALVPGMVGGGVVALIGTGMFLKGLNGRASAETNKPIVVEVPGSDESSAVKTVEITANQVKQPKSDLRVIIQASFSGLIALFFFSKGNVTIGLVFAALAAIRFWPYFRKNK